jgi:hypothetical protein
MSNSLPDNRVGIEELDPAISARVSLFLAGGILVSLAGLFGGMQYVILAIALGLAVLVIRKPEEAISAGWLFMLAAMTFLPATGRFHYIDAQTEGIDWQQYYWALGSLIIVLAGLYSVGWSRLSRSPAAVKAFFLVAVVSAIFGFFRGNDASYVIRQLYGSVLFVWYFAIANAAGDEELVFRRVKTFGVMVAFAFFVYYVTAFPQWGFHKEDTSLPIQMGILATLLFVKGVVERRASWILPSGMLVAASFLLFFRNILLTFCFGAALAVAMSTTSRTRRLVCFIVAGLILLPSVLPFGAQYVLDVLADKVPGVYDILPEGTQSSATLMDRSIQIGAAGLVLLRSPILGGGMGTEVSWDSELGSRDERYLDNGWAYLMAKMGAAGILSFGWLLFIVARCMSRQTLAISISLTAILTIVMFSEPAPFQFTMSPIVGALAGLMYARKHGRTGVLLGPLHPQGSPNS